MVILILAHHLAVALMPLEIILFRVSTMIWIQERAVVSFIKI
jgi:hypothetical protein